MITFSLSADEAKQLMMLLDAAVRAGGLGAAAAALGIAAKVDAAMQDVHTTAAGLGTGVQCGANGITPQDNDS